LRTISIFLIWMGGRLLHGDFHTGHIFAQHGKITGIIDFENAVSGDPLYDLALPLLYADIVGIQSYSQDILRGYGVALDEVLKQKIFLYKLATAISRMAWTYKEGLKRNTRLYQRWLKRQFWQSSVLS